MGLLDKQTVVVVGANGGIGHAIALRSAGAGAQVVAADIEKPLRTAAAIRDSGNQCLSLTVDITDRSQVNGLIATALEHFGSVDILVPTAAIDLAEPVLAISDENWDRVMAVNLKGGFLCIQAALPTMLQRRQGSIVLISSIAGRRASLTSGAHYTCSKYGVIGLTRHLAGELAGTGIRVNCVCPGPTDTPMLWHSTTRDHVDEIIERTPLRRLAQPDDIADVVLFLAGPTARHVNGAIVDVNGGLY